MENSLIRAGRTCASQQPQPLEWRNQLGAMATQRRLLTLQSLNHMFLQQSHAHCKPKDLFSVVRIETLGLFAPSLSLTLSTPCFQLLAAVTRRAHFLFVSREHGANQLGGQRSTAELFPTLRSV